MFLLGKFLVYGRVNAVNKTPINTYIFFVCLARSNMHTSCDAICATASPASSMTSLHCAITGYRQKSAVAIISAVGMPDLGNPPCVYYIKNLLTSISPSHLKWAILHPILEAISLIPIFFSRTYTSDFITICNPEDLNRRFLGLLQNSSKFHTIVSCNL